jgi:hypothetical protein
VVNPDGTVCNVEMIKGINESINDQCLKIISEMPKWKAGELNFENVSTSIVLPIIFGNSELVNN